MAWMKRLRKINGVIGNLRVGGRVFTHFDIGYGELGHFGGMFGGFGGLMGALRVPNG